jgi:hypothetical protein
MMSVEITKDDVEWPGTALDQTIHVDPLSA